jgi:hypothetical protein
MAQILYDANGNPIIDPSQQQQTNRLPPDVPTGSLRVNKNGQNPPQNTPQQPQQASGAQSGTAPGISSASGLIGALRQLMQHYNQQQGPAGNLNPDTQVGPPTPAPNAATGVNVNQVANPAAATGAGSSAALIGQAAAQIAKPLQDYAATANWRDIASAIPSPDQFIQQEQRQEQQYDFARNPIV